MDRSYTVQEIDDLRRVIGDYFIWGSYNPRYLNGGLSRSYQESDKINYVEQAVRTHMLAGHTAQDLRDSENKK